MLTQLQLAALAAYINASTDPNVIQWRTPATRADNALTAWLNSPGTASAWRVYPPMREIDDAPDYSGFDTLSAGKRDSWREFKSYDRDFRRNKVRKWVQDVWGNVSADTVAILTAATEPALRGEEALGGTIKTTAGVPALDRSYVGSVSMDDVSAALSL